MEVVRLELRVRKAWWFWPVFAASIVFPRLERLALAGIRVKAI
jgi:hypothetical protein